MHSVGGYYIFDQKTDLVETSIMASEISRKDQIIEAASRLFRQFGYLKTSVDDIARFLGIGKATIYHYFRSKEEIFLQVLQLEADRIAEKTRRALARVNSPSEKLAIFLKIHFEEIFRRIKNQNLTIENIYTLQPLVDKGIREFYNVQLNMLREILQEGIETRCFKKMDPHSVAVLLLSLLRSLFTPPFVLDPSLSPKRLIDNFLTIVLKGLEAEPGLEEGVTGP